MIKLDEYALQKFYNSLAIAINPKQTYEALQDVTNALVGLGLFTITAINMKERNAERVFSNDEKNYKTGGTKPIVDDKWFHQIHSDRSIFVANSIEEMSTYFPDHDLIQSLGWESVVNIPVTMYNEVKATINILNPKNHFTKDRMRIVNAYLPTLCLATLGVSTGFVR